MKCENTSRINQFCWVSYSKKIQNPCFKQLIFHYLDKIIVTFFSTFTVGTQKDRREEEPNKCVREDEGKKFVEENKLSRYMECSALKDPQVHPQFSCLRLPFETAYITCNVQSQKNQFYLLRFIGFARYFS